MSGILIALALVQPLDGAAGGAAGVDPGDHFVELIQRVIEPQRWEPQGGRGRAAMFGPLRQVGGGADRAARRGSSLSDLIQRTVEPDSWEQRGGPGRIAVFGQ